MTLKYATALRNAQQDAITTFAGNSGLLRIYAGTQPTDPQTAISAQTLLGQLTMNATSFSAASGGVLTANAITQDSSADATNTASFFRLFKSDGSTVVMDGTITATGGGGDMTLNTVSIVSGGPISCTGFAITRGNA